MTDSEFDATVRELILTKFYPRLDEEFLDCKNIIAETDFKQRMLYALNEGYVCFSLCETDMVVFSKSQQDELCDAIKKKCEPLNLHSHDFVVIPNIMLEYARTSNVNPKKSEKFVDAEKFKKIPTTRGKAIAAVVGLSLGVAAVGLGCNIQ